MADTAFRAKQLVAVLSHPEEIATVYPWSISLARQWDLPLTLLHVIDPVSSRELTENAEVMASDMLALLAEAPAAEGVDVTTAVESGMPQAEIPAFATRAPGSVFVMAGGDHGTFARTLLRRGSENVIHHLDAPLVFLPPKAGPARPIERAIAGVDGSGIAAHALEVARNLLGATPIVQVQVLEPGSVQADEYRSMAPTFTGELVRMRGRANVALLAAARARDAQLIAVGRRGHTGLFGQHLGGTAEWLSRNADRPVLIVPPRK